MPDNPVEREIRASGADDSVVFVFPSDVASGLWLEASLAITGRDTLPARRFIAWDRFKERAVQSSVAGKEPVSAIVRKLYALDLARRNRESRVPMFDSIIPAAFAESGDAFAPWIAKILPSLALLERKRRAAGTSREEGADGEDRDLALLKADYARFLDAESLFEPSWQIPPLKDAGDRFIIFFPEAIEDFAEYAELLAGAPFVRTVSAFQAPQGPAQIAHPAQAKHPAQATNPANSVNPAQSTRPGELDFGFEDEIEVDDAIAQDAKMSEPFALSAYATTRDEFKAVALEIERLLGSGTRPESIAVSVPNLESAAPYLLREFTLRSIPFEYRAGTPLGACPAGRFFARAAECVSSGYAFAHVKALLLDRSIPWRNRELAEALIEFGIRNHCVTGWREDGKTVDVWEAAFRDPAWADPADWRVRDYYRKLSTALSGLVGAKTFSEIRNRWFAFRDEERDGLLDMGVLSAEDDAVLARCVEELGSLASLEIRYPRLMPEKPFSLFVSTLDEEKYVRRRATTGVNVFPYRVAAGTPFPWHFVVDASQDGATVVYSPLDYLRQDKRGAIGVADTDASRAFFELYRRCPLFPREDEPQKDGGSDRESMARGARFSAAERTFSGYRIPHSAFTRVTSGAAPIERDAFAREAAWLRGSDKEPERLYPTQKCAAASWRARGAARGFSYLTCAYGGRVDALTARIKARLMKTEGLLVTATHLNAWSLCGAKLFLGTILKIKEESADAELLNERNIGILYHNVLETVYAKIRDEDGAFKKERIEDYRAWAEAAARDSARGYSEFRGPLAAPLIDTLADRVFDGVTTILESDAELLDGFAPKVLEGELTYAENGLSYYGRVDRISVNDEGEAVLIDYKSGYVTPTGDYEVSPDGALKDCQIPLYAFLAEHDKAKPCGGKPLAFAWFGDIRKGKYQPVIHDRNTIPWNARTRLFSREEFEPSMKAFSGMAARYADGIAREDFTRPEGLSWTECASCDFRKICRYVYSVRP
ncbi:MAG TPA: PD-(D/E)XK nuclease family protein [Treponemataceae bacterium]|nr:PD-(D/E)XK nuclease family protein [Treponemataceae bacterium]